MYATGNLPDCFQTEHVEFLERYVVSNYLQQDCSSVLEIGGGSGAVSTIIQARLLSGSQRNRHVVIQPVDGMYGALEALHLNRIACNSSFEVVDHALSEGEGVDIERSIGLPEGKGFDCIVVDCEGCLPGEFRKNKELFVNARQVIVERDDHEDFDANELPIFLEGERGLYGHLLRVHLGMELTHTGGGCDGRCVTEVWTRY